MSELATAVLTKALDGLYQRYLFTAQNISNANSPGYQPVHVTFEESLRAASQEGADAVRNVHAQTVITTSAAGAPAVRLDLELAAATQTAMRYKALIDVLGRQLALNRAVITEWGR